MSARLPQPELMLLTSVSHLAGLTPEQLVVVTFDGTVVEGDIDPGSREIVGMQVTVRVLPHAAVLVAPRLKLAEKRSRFAIMPYPIAAWQGRTPKPEGCNFVVGY